LEGVERVLLRGGTAAGGRGESVGVRAPPTRQEEERTGRRKNGGRRLENNISSPLREEDSGERDRRKSPGSRTRRWRRFVRAD
jgi:hypothetical protein